MKTTPIELRYKILWCVPGRHTVHFYATTGTVLECTKRSETHVSGSGGGGVTYNGYGSNSNVRISSTTSVHDDLHLKTAVGEQAFQLVNFNLAVRKDNRVTVLHAVRDGKKTGPYVAVVNHSNGQVFSKLDALAPLCRPAWWWSVATLPAVMTGFLFFVPAAMEIGRRMKGRSQAKKLLNQTDLGTFAEPQSPLA
jgi:hypothetical protein